MNKISEKECWKQLGMFAQRFSSCYIVNMNISVYDYLSDYIKNRTGDFAGIVSRVRMIAVSVDDVGTMLDFYDFKQVIPDEIQDSTDVGGTFWEMFKKPNISDFEECRKLCLCEEDFEEEEDV